MTAILTLLLSLLRQTASTARDIYVQLRVWLFRLGWRAKSIVFYLARIAALRYAFLVAVFAACEGALTALSQYLIVPLTSDLLRAILPDTGYCQGIYRAVWDTGLSLSVLWGHTITFLSSAWATARLVDLLADALTYRSMIYRDNRWVNQRLTGGI